MTPQELIKEFYKLSENEQAEVLENLKRIIAEDEANNKLQSESIDEISKNRKDER